MFDLGFTQCLSGSYSYNPIYCEPVVVSSIRELGTDYWLDSTTDYDQPTAGKTVEDPICAND